MAVSEESSAAPEAALQPVGAAGQHSAMARLESLVERLPAGVLLLDGSGRVVQCNAAARDLLGASLTGCCWREAAAQLFAGDGPAGTLALCDGRLVRLATAPLGSEPGQILLLQDVTDYQRLEARVSHMRRLADMGQMAANLAHQIRTPLAAAMLHVSQLKRAELAEPRRVAIATKAAERLRELERLIEDMLVLARAGTLHGEPLHAGALLHAAAAVAAEQHATLAVEIDDASEGIALHGNARLLQTALQNLVTNATQALDGCGRIVLSARPAPPHSIDLVVRDYGPGIAEAIRDTLFEPFATTRAGGTGLGLAVVRAVARAHGGDAWMEALSDGSRFGMRIPAAAAGAACAGASPGSGGA